MDLLLDTCTLLWFASGSDKISQTALSAILDRANRRFLSASSVWEIAVKHALGKLPLPSAPHLYIPDLRRRSGIAAIPVDEESALESARLPRLHSDPFDRMLVGQAITHGLTIVTPDADVAQYPVAVLW